MVTLLLTVHILVAVVLILVVLLQSARGTDIAAAFGGMGSQAAFGPRGTATFLSKATVVLAVIFMMTSITLAIYSNRQQGAGGGSSVLGGQETATESQPTSEPSPIQVETDTSETPGIQVETEMVPPPKDQQQQPKPHPQKQPPT